MTATNQGPAKNIEGVIAATGELRQWARASGEATAIALAAAITHHNWHAADTMPPLRHYESPAAQRALAAVFAGDLPRVAFNNEDVGDLRRTTTGEQAAVVLHLLHSVGAPRGPLSVLADAYGVNPAVPRADLNSDRSSGADNAKWASRRHGGIAYVPPPRAEGQSSDKSEVYLRDPDLVDRGTVAHKDIQDDLARCITEHGLEPVSPHVDDQQFDIAWVTGETLHLCEVKSLTDDNEESQLRLGLGQLLSYVHRIDLEHWGGVSAITGVLAVERPPARNDWVSICAANSVILTWPDRFSTLFEN